jgi:gamma-glutamylaminecyclotransferase
MRFHPGTASVSCREAKPWNARIATDLSAAMKTVFVYGTLKAGFPFHPLALSKAQFLGTVQTAQAYPLMIAADFFGPMMLDRPGEGLVVHGELYAVKHDQLPVLDRLEDLGASGSFRTTLQVEPEGGGLRQEAIGYMKDESWLKPLHTGYLSNYQDRRFIPPWNR